MIEGLRQLPWFESAARDEAMSVAMFRNCEKCMRDYPRSQRQEMACGYEEPIAGALAWRHRGYACDEETQPTTCPGYTTRLPEVIEAARAYVHWEKGELGSFVGRKPPHRHLLTLVEVVAGEANAVNAWKMRNPKKEGA